jgi:hypothetical protein
MIGGNESGSPWSLNLGYQENAAGLGRESGAGAAEKPPGQERKICSVPDEEVGYLCRRKVIQVPIANVPV